jgi:alkaline phosphatase
VKRTTVFLLLLLTCLATAAERRAKNVILFIGDAGGIATLNAASRYGHNAPGKLFVQNMAHQGLMETSAANALVTDSAAAMSAIVTGHKTDSGVISQKPEKEGGDKLKTILEYAEEHGLSTGVITNSPIADATPAACYAHAAKRNMTGEIFAQILKPRFGNGVEVAIGPGRKAVVDATAKLGIDIEPELKKIMKEVAQYVEQDEDVLTRALFPGPSVEFFKYRNAKRYQIDSSLLNEEDMVYPV